MKKIAAIGFALLMVFAVFVPVVSALNDPTKEGYQSVVNPNVLGERSPENIGHLDVLLACRAPQIGGEFTIVPVTVSAPFTNAARVDKAFVDQFVKQFGEPEKKQYLPDGTFDGNFAPGTYLLKQIDGNGGQPEFALVAIKAADAQTVVFLGHGITPAAEPKEDEQLPEIKVLTATYGMTKLVCVPGTPAVTHQEQRLVTAAYCDAPVHHDAVYQTVHHDAVTHQEKVIDTPAKDAVAEVSHDVYTIVQGYGQPFTGYAKEQSNNVDFVVNGHKYHIVGSSGYGTVKYLKTKVIDTPAQPAVAEVSHMETVVDHEAYDEQVLVTAAYDDAPVCHDAVYQTVTVVDTPATHTTYHLEGSFKNVKAQVQAAVDAGERTLKFDNAQNPGGLFDGDNNLLAAINDPAPGQVKKFVITYKINGHIKVKAGNEYEVFTLE